MDIGPHVSDHRSATSSTHNIYRALRIYFFVPSGEQRRNGYRFIGGTIFRALPDYSVKSSSRDFIFVFQFWCWNPPKSSQPIKFTHLEDRTHKVLKPLVVGETIEEYWEPACHRTRAMTMMNSGHHHNHVPQLMGIMRAKQCWALWKLWISSSSDGTMWIMPSIWRRLPCGWVSKLLLLLLLLSVPLMMNSNDFLPIENNEQWN